MIIPDNINFELSNCNLNNETHFLNIARILCKKTLKYNYCYKINN